MACATTMLPARGQRAARPLPTSPACTSKCSCLLCGDCELQQPLQGFGDFVACVSLLIAAFLDPTSWRKLSTKPMGWIFLPHGCS